MKGLYKIIIIQFAFEICSLNSFIDHKKLKNSFSLKYTKKDKDTRFFLEHTECLV